MKTKRSFKIVLQFNYLCFSCAVFKQKMLAYCIISFLSLKRQGNVLIYLNINESLDAFL